MIAVGGALIGAAIVGLLLIAREQRSRIRGLLDILRGERDGHDAELRHQEEQLDRALDFIYRHHGNRATKVGRVGHPGKSNTDDDWN